MRIVLLALLLGTILLAGCTQESVRAEQNTGSKLNITNATKPNATTTPAELSSQPTVYFFFLSTCSYCNAQKKETNPILKAEFPQVRWEEYEVSSSTGRARWYEMMSERNMTPRGVPVTIVGQDVIVGYYAGETEVKLRAAIKAEIARVEKK